MRIAHIFHSIDDLETRISLRFKQRLEGLLLAYRQKRREVIQETLIRSACVAWAFVQLSLDGNQAMAADFYDMLHGERPEHIEWENTYLYYNDDTENEELLMWDITCLMLEEHVGTAPQFAFDIAERHEYMAYHLPQQPVPDTKPQQPIPSAKPQRPVPAVTPKQTATADTERPATMKDASRHKTPETPLCQHFAQESDRMQDLQTVAASLIDMTANKVRWEAYAKCSKEELILGHMMKDVQLKESSNTISILTRLLSLRNTNNFYQGDIRTQINGGDIDMKPQKE